MKVCVSPTNFPTRERNAMADLIEQGAAAAPVPDTMEGLRSQNRAYRTLCASLEAQMAILTEKGREYQEAVSTLDSERQANAILTDEITALRARVAELEEENDRLTKTVGSGILGELLNDEETDEFVNFIKFLRGQSKEAGSGKI